MFRIAGIFLLTCVFIFNSAQAFAQTILDSKLEYMKLELPSHLTSTFYESLKNIEPKDTTIQIPEFGSEIISTKKIENQQFRLTASKKHSSGEYKVTFETWKNPYVLDSQDRKIIQGTGDFARNFHKAMFSQFWPNHEYRDDEPLTDLDEGIAKCEISGKLKLIFRKVDARIYFHMEVVYSNNMDFHSTGVAFMKGVPDLTRMQEFEFAQPSRGSGSTVNVDRSSSTSQHSRGSAGTANVDSNSSTSRHSRGSAGVNSVYRSGSSTYYRGLDGVTREAVRDPTGP